MSVSETVWKRRFDFYEELRRIHALSLTGPTRQVFERLLTLLLGFSESPFGFIAEVMSLDGRPEALRTLALNEDVWAGPTDELMARYREGTLEFRNFDTLFGAVVTTGQVVLSNDPTGDPRSRGLPPGHPPLRAFLGLPLWHDGRQVGMIGIANRTGGYDEAMVAELEPLLDSCTHLILAHRIERERTEVQEFCYRALAETERYRHLFDHANITALIVEPGGQRTQYNQAWNRMLGWSVEELQSMTLEQLVDPDDVAATRAHLRALRRHGPPVFDYDNRCMHRDGSSRWLRWQAVHEPSSGCIYAIATDITERLSQERKYHDRQRMVLMAESMSGVGYWYFDLNDRTVSWSDQVNRIFRIDPERVDPEREVPSVRTSLALAHPDDRAGAVQVFETCIQTLQPFEHEMRIVRRDGVTRWVRIHGGPESGPDGESRALFGVVQDVTERREAQSLLERAREQALEASRTKSQFLANMSHEIRTPLNGVLGAAGLLAGTALGDEQRELLEAIQASGRFLTETINDVLDLAKIEAGKLELETVPFSPRALIEELGQAFLLPARSKGLRWTWRVEPDVPERLRGDPTRLRQLMSNLVSNAVKFTSRGHVGLRLSYANGMIQGEVSDSGPGIASERIEAIFEPFVQADGSTTREYGGSGLGLAICRQLVAHMGGLIRCQSVVGHGTVFHFEVVLPVEPMSQPRPAADERVALPPLRVLLAEDNPINALVASKLLTRAGHSVTVVGNGVDALDTLAQESFDVVLMDVQMPRMDGLEALRHLRARERQGGVHVPVVALTANAMKGDEEACYEAGADAYVPKPIDARLLWATIGRLLTPPTA
ncbi:MAG: PAS domain S-box protein [Myxococcales bacterium]|nr:MAG: PAS domain S-box protein [Myxococcales bacterium]